MYQGRVEVRVSDRVSDNPRVVRITVMVRVRVRVRARARDRVRI